MPEVLTIYARALDREARVLVAFPSLTWQQLHNQLQWEDITVRNTLTAGRERRSGQPPVRRCALARRSGRLRH